MTQQQTISQNAGAQATSSTESSKQPGKQGDYTKYFYRNIEHLWLAVEQLQAEMSKLEDQRRKLIETYGGKF